MLPNFEPLLKPCEPWLLVVNMSDSDLTDRLWALTRITSPGIAVRFLRGKNMRNSEGLYNEFAAAMQFPYYFGYNGPAFDECMTDLEWLEATGYIIAIIESQEVLANEQDGELDLFLDSLRRICQHWSKPVTDGQPWDRPAKPFHVLFGCSIENSRRLPVQVRSLPRIAEEGTERKTKGSGFFLS